MTRPTKEQVDEALDSEEYNEATYHEARILAAEVRALREELAKEREILDNVTAERDGLREDGLSEELEEARSLAVRYSTKLGRVEALLVSTAFGRRIPEPVHEHATIPAKALRAALKGGA
jgi:hypothetical protein